MPARQLMRMASLVLVFVVIEPELYDRFDIDKTYAIFLKRYCTGTERPGLSIFRFLCKLVKRTHEQHGTERLKNMLPIQLKPKPKSLKACSSSFSSFSEHPRQVGKQLERKKAWAYLPHLILEIVCWYWN